MVRMRGRSWGLAVAVLVTLSVGACGPDDGPSVTPPTSAVDTEATGQTSTPNSSSSSETPSTTSSTGPATDGPVSTGTCLGAEPTFVRTSCDQPHYFEVYHAEKDNRFAGDRAERKRYVTGMCYEKSTAFVGERGVPFTLVLVDVAPAKVNPEQDGRVVCMLSKIEKDGEGLELRDSSLRNILKGKGAEAYNLCTKGKATATEVEVVTCDQPHAAEAVASKYNGKPGDPYPKDAHKIHSRAVEFCKPKVKAFLGGTRDDITVAENSGGKKPWEDGKMISVCFAQVEKGPVTESLKGIGDKPLSSYR